MRLEDVVGPPPTLAQPSQNAALAGTPSLALPPADTFAAADPAAPDDPSEKDAAPIAPSERLSPLLAAQENRSLFSSSRQWIGFQAENGIDATNAEGTVCSGRMNGDHVESGQNILLACSDGKSATLEIRQSDISGAKGMMIIDKVSQTASIGRPEFSQQ